MTQYGVPEKQDNLKFIAIFSALGVPAALLLGGGWILSLNTPYLNTLGQVLLVIVIAILLILASGYLGYFYVKRRFLDSIGQISQIVSSIGSRTFKTLPVGSNLGEYSNIYTQLTQLQNSIIRDYNTLGSLNKKSTAEIKLFETSTAEITDPIILIDLKNQVKYINLAAENFTGIKKLNVIGKSISQFVKLYDKNNNEILPIQYLQPRNDALNPKVYFGSEIKIVSAINTQAFADVTVFRPDLAESIDISGVILFQDKTKEKQLEAMKLDFVSMAAHELRTPLTSIKGYISVFINENQNKLTPEQLMFVRRINTSTQQLSGLVENLLSVARVERGALTLHRQIVDWVKNVDSQVETFLHRAEEKRITLTFKKPDKPFHQVNIDLVRINEVLNNLISNAINYTEPMGKIEVRVEEDNGFITTFVQDTGKGLPKDALAHLFSKFFRVQGGPAEQASKGNGLGLYLSKAIVELHQGKIWAESEGLGKGSTFAFSLPSVNDIDIKALTKIM